MKLIYIAGPFTADTWWKVLQNIRRAENMALRVAEMGAMPVCPHTMTGNFWGLQTEKFWYEGTLKLLSVCDGVVFLNGWNKSKGCHKEYLQALEDNMPMFFEKDKKTEKIDNDIALQHFIDIKKLQHFIEK